MIGLAWAAAGKRDLEPQGLRLLCRPSAAEPGAAVPLSRARQGRATSSNNRRVARRARQARIMLSSGGRTGHRRPRSRTLTLAGISGRITRRMTELSILIRRDHRCAPVTTFSAYDRSPPERRAAVIGRPSLHQPVRDAGGTCLHAERVAASTGRSARAAGARVARHGARRIRCASAWGRSPREPTSRPGRRWSGLWQRRFAAASEDGPGADCNHLCRDRTPDPPPHGLCTSSGRRSPSTGARCCSGGSRSPDCRSVRSRERY